MIADLTGRRFGRLTVERMAGTSANGRRARCKCDCGSVKIVAASALIHGRSKSCGCLRREKSSERMRRIGAASTAARQSFEQAWADAMASAERVLAPIRAKVKWEEA